MQKVMKYELHYLDGCGDFQEMQQALWALQRQTRESLNKTLQICYQWEWKSKEHFQQTGEKLSLEKVTGYKTLDGYAYSILKMDYPDIAGSTLNATIRTAYKKYNASKKEVATGTMSIPSYRRDQPILMHNKTVRLSYCQEEWIVELTVLSDMFKKEHTLKTNPRFKVVCGDKTQRIILERIIGGVYTVGQSQLMYQKKKWFLYLTYGFIPEKKAVDPKKILGVDLGVAVAIYASSYGTFDKFVIPGDEGIAAIQRLEAMRRSRQKQARYCGEGRIGHGTKTRVASAYETRDKIANLQDTLNHRWSRALVDYAVKNGYGTIQMEDLTGIREDTDFDKRLQHWTYYDLQTKITNKATEAGIAVRKINPCCTSQRCSKCGYIASENRTTQERFRCIKCGFSANADFNASQNISLADIEKIMEKDRSDPAGAKRKKAKKSE